MDYFLSIIRMRFRIIRYLRRPFRHATEKIPHYPLTYPTYRRFLGGLPRHFPALLFDGVRGERYFKIRIYGFPRYVAVVYNQQRF